MLHPSQFQVNEAWIAFQLNEAPIQTKENGLFNCVALMDAASCFILGNALMPTDSAEPSQLDVRRLFKDSWAHKKQFPTTLFVPRGQLHTVVPAEAKRSGITVVPVEENQLLAFIGEARRGFREHVQVARKPDAS